MKVVKNKCNGITNKNLIKTFSAFLLIFFFAFCLVNQKVFAEEDSKNLGIKSINDPKYVWTVAFTNAGDFNSIKNNIGVRELNGNSVGKLVNVKVEPGEDDKTVKIIPPTSGYEIGKSYRIIVGKGAKSKNDKNMKRDVLLDFKVTSEIKVNVKVEVSEVLSILKKISVDCDKTANVKKYKIEGNNNLFHIDKEAITLFNGNSAKIYLCDNENNILGEGTIDVSKSNENTIIVK